jgi:hypothetical protein
MSYKGQVQVHRDLSWYDNALRFATQEEAAAYVLDLSFRWMQVDNTQVVESDDPVNYRFNFETGRAERIAAKEVAA